MSANTICIIDDDKIYQSLTKKILLKLVPDIQILQFLDGSDALEYFKECLASKENLPSVVLLDINMPYMDGWDFLSNLETISIDFTKVNIHVVSSSIALQDMEKAKSNAHIISYITKPVKPEILKNIMEYVV
ncbi:response regulator [Neptunitalea lumnitzerae]|uniref:Response regulator n=1 Tax=Neptunitalea lumnitzerae TaxID=2965509 RepID=A0ABQ5MJE9_9FLAO|nr:response regulator [Neptunitalea sp. Y10]GLB49462.1 response regulator [Neptunitalea sp. Y10]